MADVERLITKVLRLRDLAARAGTLAEAQAATAQAEAIIAKYRIEEADLEAAGAQTAEAFAPGGKAARNAFRVGAVYGVRDSLARSAAAVARELQATATAMVLADRAKQAERAYEADNGKIRTVSARFTISDGGALQRGQVAGRRMHLGAALPNVARALPERTS